MSAEAVVSLGGTDMLRLRRAILNLGKRGI